MEWLKTEMNRFIFTPLLGGDVNLNLYKNLFFLTHFVGNSIMILLNPVGLWTVKICWLCFTLLSKPPMLTWYLVIVLTEQRQWLMWVTLLKGSWHWLEFVIVQHLIDLWLKLIVFSGFGDPPIICRKDANGVHYSNSRCLAVHSRGTCQGVVYK